MKVLLGGEGPTDLGRFANHPSHRNPTDVGVIEGLLRKVRPKGWSVVEGVRWKDIRKFKAGGHRQRETRNVLGLVLMAKEKGCDAVAFVRDRDGTNADPNIARQAEVEQGIQDASQVIANCPKIIGGMAVEKLESWLLALRGEVGSESRRQPESLLQQVGVLPKSTPHYMEVVLAADLGGLPADATSLKAWLQRAKDALPPSD